LIYHIVDNELTLYVPHDLNNLVTTIKPFLTLKSYAALKFDNMTPTIACPACHMAHDDFLAKIIGAIGSI